MAEKAGLDYATDFTKFVIALDSTLIAFVTGATFLQKIEVFWEKVLVLLIVFLLVASLTAGIFVFMRAATMISTKNYDLEDPHLKMPGAINVIAFALGAIAIGVLAAFELVLEEERRPPATQQFQLVCGQSVTHDRLICRGMTLVPAK
ncbi:MULTISPECIES: hypothetical protein [unclassified Sphingomonas]|uniref:hypothetical protein n=1 Tax=unclassified Sphingomonas TaxID=196159 RepID=UPI000BC470C3|nr:MAG: hypothetical protein B7Z43_11580 [Sphingomonas sp. 12-62-6]OYX36809.1 MAG: hypothetical protein B7Y98_14695 [Sphingomonas sp. 32-62-10]